MTIPERTPRPSPPAPVLAVPVGEVWNENRISDPD
jgi:hypothetical protein